MEPFDGSAKLLADDNLQLYQHRGSNTSGILTPKTSFTGDSGYTSYLTTSHSSHNLSLNSPSNLATITSTPRRLSHSNLTTIPENSDPTKLTPVTQNIRNICDFHITTPKGDQLILGQKRSSVAILNFEDLESTPKKLKTDEEFHWKNAEEMLSGNTTPRKTTKLRPKKHIFRQKLNSAPNLTEFFNENNFENEQSPRRGNLSPIHCKSVSRGSRTPLSSLNLIRASTPKSGNYGSGVNEVKQSSVKKLLKFSDSQFDRLVNSGCDQTLSVEESQKLNFRKITFDRIDDDDTDSVSLKTLSDISFVTSSEDLHGVDIVSEQASRNYKTVMRSVIHDREISSSQILQPKNGQNRKTIAATTTSSSTASKSNKDKTETKYPGFKGILNISNNCHDMEISAICDCISSPPIAVDNKNKNYSIKTEVDLELNASIECETRPPTYASTDSLPRTPKKQKPTSVEHERLEILYPMIRRTPSKYNPLTRAPLKRKSDQSLSKTYKRQCKFFGNNTHLNIIAKLGPYGHLLDQIFRNLSVQDLVNMCDVAGSWRTVVHSNSRASHLVRRHLKNCRLSKENDRKTLTDAIKEISKPESFQRLPFTQINMRIDHKCSIVANRSPPVSPSKRKFHENQKVVKTLAPNEKLIKCPRCTKSSRIYNDLHHNNNNYNNGNINSAATTSTNKISQFRSSSQTFHSLETSIDGNPIHSLPFFITNNNSTFQRQRLTKALSLDSSSLAETDLTQFGECSSLQCRYRFCLRCLCDYHPGTKCLLSESSSPSKDDLQNGILQLTSSTRSIKNARKKSLKRLCF